MNKIDSPNTVRKYRLIGHKEFELYLALFDDEAFYLDKRASTFNFQNVLFWRNAPKHKAPIIKSPR